jgi:Zn-dependent protease with chaperone function
MMPRLLVGAGLVLLAIGGLWMLLQRAGFRGLPGDITIQREGWSFSFPIVTCLVLSVLLTLILNMVSRR